MNLVDLAIRVVHKENIHTKNFFFYRRVMAQAKSGLRDLIYHRTFKNVNAVTSRLYGIFSLSVCGQQVKPATTTPLSRGSCMEGSTLIHWNPLWIVCLVIPSVSYFSFVQVMVFWESISRREKSRNEVIIEPSNVWTYYARWHRYFASLIETNVFEISCLLCISFFFVIFM